jgi:ADP-heptose:LPS heptosyltransferase
MRHAGCPLAGMTGRVVTEEKGSILVIKHGALGDIVLAMPAFAAIRAHHPYAHIACLTTEPYAKLMSASPYFDEIRVDSKPRLTNVGGLGRLRSMLRSRRWEWVYDLQTSTRTTFYQWLFARPWPKISNVSRWASHGYTAPERHQMHAYENLKKQLHLAGIENLGMPDMSWLTADISEYKISRPYALLVPGGAAHRPEKRWPAECYAALAESLVAKKITPVLIGTQAERAALESISAQVSEAQNLCGKTSFAQLATLARTATLVVGNDTGPMHIIAASNCPSIVLFSHASNPAYSAPIGRAVRVLREKDLRDLSVDRVLAVLETTVN